MSEGREKMSAVDAAWLHMDSATQRMVINAAFRFAEPITLAEVRLLVAERVVAHVRFRQRAVEPVVPIGTPHWEEVLAFDPSGHVHELLLEAPGDDDALAAVIGAIVGTPLERTRPLWEMHLIQGHQDGPVLLVRMHHAIGDGVHLVRLLLALTDHAEAAPAAAGLAFHQPHGLLELGRTAVSHTVALARMMLLPSDPPTALRGPLGPAKCVAWTRALSLGTLHDIAHRHGAKLNDLLVAATAGAIRRYLRAREGLPSAAELRALVPVFLQGHGESELGNHFGLVFVPLLVGHADPHARLRATKLENDRVKHSPDAAVAIEVLALMGGAGPQLEHLGIDLFTRKASCMITNVPGPSARLRLGGRAIDDLIVWAPVAGHLGLGISLVSYDGHVRVGVLSDEGLVPDPAGLARAWEDEVELLAAS